MLLPLCVMGRTTLYSFIGTCGEALRTTRAMLDAFPPMTLGEQREASSALRAYRILPAAGMTGRPLRSVHHTISPGGLFGNGASIGEVSLCHLGAMLMREPLAFGLGIRKHLPTVLHEGRALGVLARPVAVVLHVERP